MVCIDSRVVATVDDDVQAIVDDVDWTRLRRLLYIVGGLSEA